MPTKVFTKVAAMRGLYTAQYTHSGVQSLINWIMDNNALSQFQLSKRSGLSPAAIFQIVKKSEKDVSRPPRRSTVVALARVVGADVVFDRENRFHLTRTYDLDKTPKGAENSLFFSQIATVLMGSLAKTKRQTFTSEEKQRILGVVKAVVA